MLCKQFVSTANYISTLRIPSWYKTKEQQKRGSSMESLFCYVQQSMYAYVHLRIKGIENR